MNLLNKQAEPQATNEFDQVIVGNSLSKDAWRRLKKNKMAVISVFIVIIYVLLAICALSSPSTPTMRLSWTTNTSNLRLLKMQGSS